MIPGAVSAEFLAAALPEACHWAGRPGPEELAALPGTPAVLLFVDGAGRPVLLMTAQQLRRGALARLCAPAETRRGRTDLAAVVRGVRWRAVHCPFEARWWHYRLARALHPADYRKRIGFGPAWFLHVDWARALPELRVTERIWCEAGEYVGPWPTHKACQDALAGLWDLFDLCRYPEQVRKAPHGQRCAYAEMGRCDAPCDGSVPPAAYVARCREAWRFATGGGAAWTDAARGRMRAAATAQDYEQAGQIKQQLAFAEKWAMQWAGHVRAALAWRTLLVLPVTRRKAWKLYRFRDGDLWDGPVAAQRKLRVTVLEWLRAADPRAALAAEPAVRMEQTWLVSHLRFHREGQAALLLDLAEGDTPETLAEELERRATARAGDAAG